MKYDRYNSAQLKAVAKKDQKLEAVQVKIKLITYLLLIEFEVRTVKYGPSFFPSIYGPSAKRAGHKSMRKNEDPFFTLRTEKTRLIRYLLYLSFWRKETISSQSRLYLNDARVKCKKKVKFIGLRKQFPVGSQRRESKLQTF